MNVTWHTMNEFSVRYPDNPEKLCRVYVEADWSRPEPDAESFKRFHEDLDTWFSEHVDGRMITDNENYPRDQAFVMEMKIEPLNLLYYLFEILTIRARPFAFELVRADFYHCKLSIAITP